MSKKTNALNLEKCWFFGAGGLGGHSGERKGEDGKELGWVFLSEVPQNLGCLSLLFFRVLGVIWL